MVESEKETVALYLGPRHGYTVEVDPTVTDILIPRAERHP